MDSRRVKLQLRVVETLMRVARPADRKQMRQRAIEILDVVAVEIEPMADAELTELLAATRAEVERADR